MIHHLEVGFAAVGGLVFPGHVKVIAANQLLDRAKATVPQKDPICAPKFEIAIEPVDRLGHRIENHLEQLR